MKQIEEIEEALNAKIPETAISTRAMGGVNLSYLETWYVIDRMNQVFGPLNWSKETTNLYQVEGTQRATYTCKVRVTVYTPDGRQAYRDGYGYGNDKHDKTPHELAVKAAESDAFKRAAMQFGLSLGLALYSGDDKYIEGVNDVKEEKVSKANTKASAEPSKTSVQNSKASNGSENNQTTTSNVDAVRKTVKSAARTLIAQGKVTAETFTKELAGNKKVDDMTPIEVLSTYSSIKTKYPELGLQ